MSFLAYMKEKILGLILLIFLLFSLEFILYVFNCHLFVKIYLPVLMVASYAITVIVEYVRKKNFYDKLKSNVSLLDQKYYVFEMLQEPSFLEGKIVYEALDEITKSVFDRVNSYKYQSEEYREYIELWVHEIKTPIASSKLIIENNKNKVTANIEEELDKIEEFVEQALYYARSNVVEKDYIVNNYSLKNIINTVIKKNKDSFIQKKIGIVLENIDQTVNTDSKWLAYILNQIILNSIQYAKPQDAILKIYTKRMKDSIKLFIEDNGIGIAPGDIPRVFEKGFTGESGRNYTKSTGMGLYLCKNLLTKLGHDIHIKSKLGEGSTVVITFPENSLIHQVIPS